MRWLVRDFGIFVYGCAFASKYFVFGRGPSRPGLKATQPLGLGKSSAPPRVDTVSMNSGFLSRQAHCERTGDSLLRAGTLEMSNFIGLRFSRDRNTGTSPRP
jgi:hypothetical protein